MFKNSMPMHAGLRPQEVHDEVDEEVGLSNLSASRPQKSRETPQKASRTKGRRAHRTMTCTRKRRARGGSNNHIELTSPRPGNELVPQRSLEQVVAPPPRHVHLAQLQPAARRQPPQPKAKIAVPRAPREDVEDPKCSAARGPPGASQDSIICSRLVACTWPRRARQRRRCRSGLFRVRALEQRNPRGKANAANMGKRATSTTLAPFTVVEPEADRGT